MILFEDCIKLSQDQNGGGWIIKLLDTEKQISTKIKFIMDNTEQCCEEFGFIETHENIEEFKNQEIKYVSLVDEEGEEFILIGEKMEGNTLIKPKIPLEGEGLYFSAVIFLNVQTDKDLLQFTVYNSHHGDYAHDVKVEMTKTIQYKI